MINLQELDGIATGLVAAGALGRADADRILSDLRKTMERAGWLTVVTNHGSAGRQFTASAFARKPAATGTPELLRVVSLAGRSLKQGEVTRTLVSLEVWSTMLVLRSAVPSDSDWAPGSIRQFYDSRWRWRAWDDEGTQYRSTAATGGGSSGSGDLVFDNRVFFPSPPDGATSLTVIAEHPEHQAAVDLPLVCP